MFKIDPETNAIKITRGDSGNIYVTMTGVDGEQYIPKDGDVVRMIVSNADGEDALFSKKMNNETMMICIQPKDTTYLAFGNYYYDIQLVKEDGYTDTFINRAKFKILWEAGD